ncbi:hypothetical protein GLOIN_2v1788091 [Rhizophagus clarus]|uniref:BED-type domain-containing protein n=1 Tax=Rhizophagus clarus TaxID=94130 RepID=A0A8H3M053_9GLOM|nr:hypothetical protein GLOIN_2v1788091 [Rhizophagus clarus]
MSVFMFYPDTDADSDQDSFTPLSTQSSKDQKKQKSNKNDSELVYCKICEYELSGLHKKPYAYTRKGENTSSMISHLRDKYGITKDNFTDFLDEHREI